MFTPQINGIYLTPHTTVLPQTLRRGLGLYLRLLGSDENRAGTSAVVGNVERIPAAGNPLSTSLSSLSLSLYAAAK